jgi:hypothetical protein
VSTGRGVIARRGSDRPEGRQRPDGELRQDAARCGVEGFGEVEIVERTAAPSRAAKVRVATTSAPRSRTMRTMIRTETSASRRRGQLGLEIDDLGQDGEIATGAQRAAADILEGGVSGRANAASASGA